MDTALYTVDTPPKKSSKRVTVTLHLVPGKDDDLIKIAQAVPAGQRMSVFKSALRGIAAKDKDVFAPQQRQLPLMMPDHSQTLKLLVGKMEWMETALNDMPGYFENLIREVASTRPARTKTTPASTPPPEPEPERVPDDVLKQRSERAKKAGW